MNNNKNYLSLGNIISTIKSVSNNKNAMQIEIFCSIFDENNINVTTVNNYCIGIRAIGIEYKNKFNDKYNQDKKLFLNNVLSIINILENKIFVLNNDSLKIINKNEKLKKVLDELLQITTNDEHITNEYLDKWKKLNQYDCFIELLNYAINYNKQPVYTQNINIKINKDELDEYLKIKLYYGQKYYSGLVELARKNNMYACADLGALWFDGVIDGNINFDKSYDYYLKSAKKNHPKGCWMVANLMLTGRVKYDFDTMWKYLNKSITLGSAAGYNTLGLCYLKGINPEKKVDLEKAKYNFELSSNLGYVYAFNNLGKMLEKDNYEEAIKYYKISADMMESWALNKVGEYYRQKGNLKLAFIYYNKAITCPLNERNPHAYYNLAKYYYEVGNDIVPKDKEKAKYYYEMYNKLKGE